MHRNKLRGRGKQMGNVWQEKEVVKKEKMGLEGKGGGIVMGKRRRRGGGWDCKGGRMGTVMDRRGRGDRRSGWKKRKDSGGFEEEKAEGLNGMGQG